MTVSFPFVPLSLIVQSGLPLANRKRHALPFQRNLGPSDQLQPPAVPFPEPELHAGGQHPQSGKLHQPGESVSEKLGKHTTGRTGGVREERKRSGAIWAGEAEHAIFS